MSLDDPVLYYATEVLAGRIVAGPHVRATCKRHLDNLKDGWRRGLYWDLRAAQRAFGFFHDVLRLSEGQFEALPFELHISQSFIVGSIFGWKKTPDGSTLGESPDQTLITALKRRFRRAYIEEGKGSGKSPLAGGIGLYGLVADSESGAQIFAAAAKRDQADILFQDAVKMVAKSPALHKRTVRSGINPVINIAYPDALSFFRPLGRDTGKTGSGLRPHFVLIDELHEHPNRDVLELLERGFKFRRQPLIFMITNAGSSRTSVCWEEHQHAVRVAHGDAQDDSTFSYVCALDPGENPLEDPSCWIKVNPLLGITVTEEYLRDVVQQAKAIPGKRNNILRLHFCVWTDAETAWIAREEWEACEDGEMTLEDFEGEKCWIGLDLGATKDLVALAFLFEDGFTEASVDTKGKLLSPQMKLALFARGYTPRETMVERARRDQAQYDVWADDGWIQATPGKVIRLDFVARDLIEYSQMFDIQAVAYDQWLIRVFKEILDNAGADLPLIEHPQGTNRRKDTPLWMPDSIDTLESMILQRRLRIESNPMLRSAVSCATFWTSPAGLRRFEKQRATGRIDAAVAAAMGVGAACPPAAELEREPEFQMMVFG